MSTDTATTTTNIIAPVAESPMAHVTGTGNDLAFMTEKAAFDHLWRVASSYARSMITPENFRAKPDDCFIVCQLAIRLKVDPFMLMQGMYIVHGRPGFEAKLAIALANQRGGFRDRIRFRMEGEGKSRKCTAYAHDRSTGDLLESEVTWAMVEGEGWNKDKESRSGYVQKSKWNTMPDQMFRYRSAMFLIRTFCPEVLMGVPTVDEIEDATYETTFQPMPSQIADNRPQTACEEKTKSEVMAEMLGKKKPEEAKKPEAKTPPPARQELTADEKNDLEDWRLGLKELTTIGAVDSGEKNISASASPLLAERMRQLCEMRRAEIKGSRGEKSNKSLLP